MRKGQVHRASPPGHLHEALDRQRHLLHGQDLRNYWNLPKVIFCSLPVTIVLNFVLWALALLSTVVMDPFVQRLNQAPVICLEYFAQAAFLTFQMSPELDTQDISLNPFQQAA